MKMTRTGFWATLVALPLFAFILYAALNWFRIEETSRQAGMGPEAARDPYLAYTRLLAKRDARARFSDRPSSLDAPPEGGVVLLASRRLVYMSAERVARLAAWVERGGTLVVEAEPGGIDDPLIEALGVDRALPDAAATARKSLRPRQTVRRPGATTFDWKGAGTPLRVDFGYLAVPLREERPHRDAVAAKVGDDTVALAFAHGAGRAVVLGSFVFLRNTQIGMPDHAELGWQLAAEGRDRGALLFLRPPRAALGEWLVAEAWPVLIAAGLLLAIWLLRVIPRFGPLAPEAAPPRRRLSEHIAATGRFLWARGEAAFLIEAARERVWRLASRRFSRLGSLPQDAALEKVAESAGASRMKAYRALAAPAVKEPDFVAAASALQEIEAHLGRPRASRLSRKGHA